MKEEYIIKVCQYLYFKDKDGNRRKKFGNWNTYIYLGNIPESWIDDRDFLDRLKELVRLGDSPDYIDIVPLSELPEEKQAKVRNDFVINGKDHKSAQYRINAYIDRKLKQTPAPETAPAAQTPGASKQTKQTQAGAGSSDYTHITFEIAKKVLEMLIEGKTQIAIAQELKFSERQFRNVPELKNIKKWIKEGKSERELQLRNFHQYGFLKDDELKDELNDLQYGYRKL